MADKGMTLAIVLLVAGLIVGGGIGYFAAPQTPGGSVTVTVTGSRHDCKGGSPQGCNGQIWIHRIVNDRPRDWQAISRADRRPRTQRIRRPHRLRRNVRVPHRRRHRSGPGPPRKGPGLQVHRRHHLRGRRLVKPGAGSPQLLQRKRDSHVEQLLHIPDARNRRRLPVSHVHSRYSPSSRAR